jgi:cytochrome c-type biogenesis protein CcmH/NrfG
LILACRSHDDDARSHNDLYREGVALISPYLRLSDRPPQPIDPHKLARGIALMERVVAMNPQNASAFWFLGMGYRAQHDDVRSYDAFKKAYAIKPDQVDIGRELGIACLDVGKAEEAIPIARHAVALKPDEPGLQANLALALLLAGHLDDAEREARGALSRSPSDVVTRRLVTVIDDVKSGKRPQPHTVAELER